MQLIFSLAGLILAVTTATSVFGVPEPNVEEGAKQCELSCLTGHVLKDSNCTQLFCESWETLKACVSGKIGSCSDKAASARALEEVTAAHELFCVKNEAPPAGCTAKSIAIALQNQPKEQKPVEKKDQQPQASPTSTDSTLSTSTTTTTPVATTKSA